MIDARPFAYVPSSWSTSCRGGRDRARRHERFLEKVHAHVEPFEAVGTEEDEVARFGEDDNGRCRPSARVQNRETNLTFQNATVCRLKAIDAYRVNRQRLQVRARDPVVFAAGIDHDVGEKPTLIRQRRMGDF